jgi:hypothetical protein
MYGTSTQCYQIGGYITSPTQHLLLTGEVQNRTSRRLWREALYVSPDEAIQYYVPNYKKMLIEVAYEFTRS